MTAQDDASMSTTGGCLCRQLRYEVDGTPAYAGFCHCPDCRRATGTGHSCFIGYPTDAVRISGEARAFGVVGGSGAQSYRHFCPVCGTHVFGRRDPDDGTLTIYAGTLDEPEKFRPAVAVFVRSRLDWDRSALDLQERQTLE